MRTLSRSRVDLRGVPRHARRDLRFRFACRAASCKKCTEVQDFFIFRNRAVAAPQRAAQLSSLSEHIPHRRVNSTDERLTGREGFPPRCGMAAVAWSKQTVRKYDANRRVSSLRSG